MTSNPSADLHVALKGARAQGRRGDIDLYERFVEIKGAAKDWLKDLGKNGYQHSERLEHYLAELTKKLITRDLLTQAEIFVLLCAAYMHDLGYWHDGHLEVKGHPERSRKLVEDRPTTYLLGDFPSLGGATAGVAQAVGWVCYGHTEETYLPLLQVPNSFADQSLSGEILNLRKLSALLRLADEADDPYIRLSEHETPSIRSITPLVQIGEETIRWYWRETGAHDPAPWVRHLKEKQRLLATSIDYLRDLTTLNWYLVLEPQVPETTLPLPDKPSIAVLPFTNMSDDPKQEYLADGLAEEIINALSKLSNVFVIARNSTFTYKGKPVRVQQVAEELGVQYVLEGSVRTMGDKVRITAQLVDALTGNHLMSERYERDLKDLFAVQDDVTMKVLTSLRVQLTEGESARTFARGTNNLEAYLKLLQAYEQRVIWNKESQTRARQLDEEAITLDPGYALAYSHLAMALMNEVVLGVYDNPQKVLERAYGLAEKAATLDDSLAWSHMALGLMSIMYKKDWDKGIAEGQRAIAVEPGSAYGYGQLAIYLTFAGRHEDAIPYYRKAFRLSPRPLPIWSFNLAWSYTAMGQYEEAIKMLKSMTEKQPDQVLAHIMLADAYVLSGREDNARKEAAEVLRIDPTYSVERSFSKLAFKDQAEVGRLKEALSKAGLK